MITIKLTFTKNDLQGLLDAAAFGNEPLKIEDLTKKELANLKYDLQNTPFVEEIVEGAEEYCANDWLQGWGNNEEDEDE